MTVQVARLHQLSTGIAPDNSLISGMHMWRQSEKVHPFYVEEMGEYLHNIYGALLRGNHDL